MTKKIVIEGELYSSKNHKQLVRNKATGRIYMLASKTAKEQEEVLCAELLRLKPQWLRLIEGKQTPYKLHIFLYRQTKRRFDYINILQSCFDMMTRMGYWEDDNANIVAPQFDGYVVDKDNPRTEMWIE